MQRRKLLKIIGGSSAFLAGSAYIWAAPTAKSARAPWSHAGQYADPIRTALSYAILAPNPHNRQPWLVDLINDTEAILYCDKDRHLPMTDPLDRQITIGLGCFLELFDIAAKQNGHRADIDIFPKGGHDKRLDSRPVARLRLTPQQENRDPLFVQITNRYTDRSPYTDKAPSAENMAIIQLAAGKISRASTEARRVETLRSICRNAARIEFLTPRVHEESVALMRVGRKAVKASPDGVSIEGKLIELLNLSNAMNKHALADPNSTAFKQGLKMVLDGIDSARGYLWITTPDNSRVQQIRAGRAYMRAQLKATELGLAMHPLSQALQEYPEMAEQLETVHRALDIENPARLQMLVRIGYGNAQAKSPRWPLESRIQ